MRLLSIVLLLLFVPNSPAQPRPQTARNGGRVVVTPRKVVIVRRGNLIKGIPGKRTATVVYPVISGLKDPGTLRRVQSILTVKNAFDTSLEEYRQDTWLDEFSFKVNFNQNYILDLTFTQSGSGAYPDTHTKHFALNLRTGTIIRASDVFVGEKLQSLAALVNRKLQGELQQILKENSGSGSDAEDTRIIKDSQEGLEFKRENLADFSVGAKGVTFLYDAGYPHAIQAFEPTGRYFFTYAELKPYLKRDGLLWQFLD